MGVVVKTVVIISPTVVIDSALDISTKMGLILVLIWLGLSTKSPSITSNITPYYWVILSSDSSLK